MNDLFPWQDPLQLQVKKYFGKYAGIVKSNTVEDLELDNREHHIGEIIVQVPGILEDSENGQGPIEIIAKPSFAPGFFFVPEVDSQVWVEFVAGDIDFPIWTGVWYPVEGVPKTFDDANPDELQKVFRTKAGHTVQFDNTDGEEKVVIFHKSSTSITLDKDGNVILEHKGGAKLELKDDTTVEITSDTINLIGGEEINITGTTKIDGTLEVTQATTLKDTLDVDGDSTIKGALTVGSGPSTTIDGNEITGA